MNPVHLLEHAGKIASSDPAELNASVLRRAISTAYYSVFHLLTGAGSARIASHKVIQQTVSRKYDHGKMLKVSDSIAKGYVKDPLKSLLGPVPTELIQVASIFAELQEKRHLADYDSRPSADFSPLQTIQTVEQAKKAFSEWEKVNGSIAAEAYLLAMLMDFPDR